MPMGKGPSACHEELRAGVASGDQPDARTTGRRTACERMRRRKIMPGHGEQRWISNEAKEKIVILKGNMWKTGRLLDLIEWEMILEGRRTE